MKVSFPLLLLSVVVFLSGCAGPKAMYEWGEYEGGLYKYYKSPDTLDKYAETLAELVAKGQRDDRVPPGLYAEYGYVLFTLNKMDEAKSYFELEKKTWPESSHLMDVMLKNVKSSQERRAPSLKEGQ